MFGRLLGWYTIYTFSEALYAPWRNFVRCKIHFTSQVLRSAILSASLHGIPAAGVSQTLRRGIQGIEIRTFAECATYVRQGGHHVGHRPTFSLWPPYVIGGPLYFCPVVSFFFYLSSIFFPRLISAVGDWMFTILWHMVWP